MNKKRRIILTAGLVAITSLLILCGYGLYLMSIEDRYGDFQEVYYNAADRDIIIINDKDVGFIKKLDGEVYVEQDECLKHLLNYMNEKIEVYHVEVMETYINISYEDALRLKAKPNSRLIYKN